MARKLVEREPTEHVEVADLSELSRDLRYAVRTGAEVPAGRLWGLPELPTGECWVDMAGAAVLADVAPRTITSWLARGGPKLCPFPGGSRFMYRLYWPRSVITSWVQEYRAARTAES